MNIFTTPIEGPLGAIQFSAELINGGIEWHPDDSATDCLSHIKYLDNGQREQLDKQMVSGRRFVDMCAVSVYLFDFRHGDLTIAETIDRLNWSLAACGQGETTVSPEWFHEYVYELFNH